MLRCGECILHMSRTLILGAKRQILGTKIFWTNFGDQIVSPQNLYTEVLTTNVTIFGNRAYKKVTS